MILFQDMTSELWTMKLKADPIWRKEILVAGVDK